MSTTAATWWIIIALVVGGLIGYFIHPVSAATTTNTSGPLIPYTSTGSTTTQ